MARALQILLNMETIINTTRPGENPDHAHHDALECLDPMNDTWDRVEFTRGTLAPSDEVDCLP